MLCLLGSRVSRADTLGFEDKSVREGGRLLRCKKTGSPGLEAPISESSGSEIVIPHLDKKLTDAAECVPRSRKGLKITPQSFSRNDRLLILLPTCLQGLKHGRSDTSGSVRLEELFLEP